MNSRFVPITAAIVSFSVAIFFIVYFSGLWRWIIASPLLVLVTWPSLKVGFLSPQEEVDKLTGADKFERPINPCLLLAEIVSFSRYILYAVIAYLSFTGIPFYIAPLMAAFVSLAKTFNPVRYNLIVEAKGKYGFIGILKTYPYFYIHDFIIVCIVYGLGVLAQKIL
tara:strand:- start:1192 stop:1692 length:501 start_codon:yes stop_codon:yes gene_type:complete